MISLGLILVQKPSQSTCFKFMLKIFNFKDQFSLRHKHKQETKAKQYSPEGRGRKRKGICFTIYSCFTLITLISGSSTSAYAYMLIVLAASLHSFYFLLSLLVFMLMSQVNTMLKDSHFNRKFAFLTELPLNLLFG